jgi:tetratricopeptide (TPR) repeat protein
MSTETLSISPLTSAAASRPGTSTSTMNPAPRPASLPRARSIVHIAQRKRPVAAWVLMLGLMARTGLAADPLDAPRDARAASASERVVALNEEGSALYTAGDYRRAAERFLQAYAIEEDPNLLFNIASCYEALGDIGAALEKYRAFLAAPDADPEGRPRAEQAIVRWIALESPPPAETPQPPVAPAPAALVPGATDEGTHDAGWVPWVGLGGGVALGVLGTAFYSMGAADHSEVTHTPGFDDPDSVAGITRRRADGLVRSGDTKKAIGVASASAGAALIVGSAVWWWLLEPAHPSSANAGLDVTLNPSRAELRFSGAF